MYYKIPLSESLTNVHYRDIKYYDEFCVIDYNAGTISSTWKELNDHTIVDEIGENPFIEEQQEQEVIENSYEDLVQAELLLNQINIMAKQEEQDEVLAEILLNQLGV